MRNNAGTWITFHATLTTVLGVGEMAILYFGHLRPSLATNAAWAALGVTWAWVAHRSERDYQRLRRRVYAPEDGMVTVFFVSTTSGGGEKWPREPTLNGKT